MAPKKWRRENDSRKNVRKGEIIHMISEVQGLLELLLVFSMAIVLEIIYFASRM